MTAVLAFDELVAQYAEKVRANLESDGEYAYAVGFVAALTDPGIRHSNAVRLLHVRAVVAAAEQVRAERAGVLV